MLDCCKNNCWKLFEYIDTFSNQSYAKYENLKNMWIQDCEF